MDTEVNEQIAQLKSQLLMNQQEILALDKNIGKTKMLQLKASTILKSLENKEENDNFILEAVDEKFKKYICTKKKTDLEKKLEDPQTIEKLKQQRDELNKKLLEIKTHKRNLAANIYKVKLEIAEQKVNSKILMKIVIGGK